jgi:DNA-binding NtrC family response regulator
MADMPSTLDVVGSNALASEPRDERCPALMIAWAAAEPARIGEVALFEAGQGARLLGRGEAGGGRVVFYRQRPGRNERTGPLSSPGISREQLRVRVDGGRLRVDRIGKCAMVVRGESVDSAHLAPGETVLLKGQMLLACTQRPRILPALRNGTLAGAHAFGSADAHGIVGESPAIWRLRDQLAWIAGADQHTLVLGGSGSGKELCARAIHALSRRARGPFVARNAATIPHGILDAELFGNVKSYPNPGMPERPGLIGAADGGTLFLDEIGELPQSLQANLLRVLDEGGEYHRLGASAASRSRFRLVGATNRDPEALKHDLAARLVLRVEVPGLDERLDDIPFLVRRLLVRAAEASPEPLGRFFEAGEPRLRASLIDHLLHASYATNLRELSALLWRAMATSQGNAVAWNEGVESGPVAPPSPPPDEPPIDLETADPEPAADEIRAALAAENGNIVRTARALGLSSRYVLYRLMRKHGIEVEPAR